MANPIRRIVQLVLDRNAAKKTEDDSKKSLSGIDRAINRVRSAALRLGGALAAAFAVRRIVNFGREAVRTANEANAIWNRLAGTVNNAGGNFEELEPQIRRVARAMQDATTVGDEDFAATLQSLVNISQDVEGSLENVSVVTDLAAGANIDLTTSALLVGRAMVGQTSLLSRYGIVVAEGADAIETLRNQFKGMAANEAVTLEGQTKQLSNEWADFKEALGNALIAAGNGTSVIATLTATVRTAAEWIDTNRESIARWGSVAVRIVRAVAGTFMIMARNITNAFQITGSQIALLFNAISQTVARTVNTTIKGLNLLPGVNIEFRMNELTPEEFKTQQDALLKDISDNIRDSVGTVGEFTQLVGGVFSGGGGEGQQSGGVRPTIAPRESQQGETLSDEAKKALEDLEKEAARITQSVRTPLEVYRDTVAQLRQHRDADRISQETYNRALMETWEQYNNATNAARKHADETDRVSEALRTHQQNLETTRTLAAALGDEINLLGEEETSLLETMRVFAEEGIASTDDRFVALTDRLAQVRAGLRLTNEEMDQTAKIATLAGELVGAAFGSGIGPLAAGKAKQNAVLAAEELVHAFAASLSPFTASTVPGHLAAAGKYAAVSAAWGALASQSGGGVGGISGGISSPSVSRDANGFRTEGMMASTEINIYIDPMSPTSARYQENVLAAAQLARERFGEQKVNVYPRTGG